MIERHKNNRISKTTTIEIQTTMNSSATDSATSSICPPIIENRFSRFSNNNSKRNIFRKKIAPSRRTSSSLSSASNNLVMSSSFSSSLFCLPKMAALASLVFLLSFGSFVSASQRSIHLDSTGHYKGIVIGFSNDFKVDPDHRATVVNSIMDQVQNTSDIVKQLLGVQFGEVNIILPEDWDIMDELREHNVVEAQYKPLKEADILFTDDDKEQILTMQFGECGEGALPINFPKKYISDQYTARLLAHQWILYRYGVFNEFGYVNDNSYPVYFAPVDGGVRNQTKGIITSCSNRPEFNYSSQCTNEPITVDPNTGLPVSPNCDVMPVENSIQSSFMYAPLAVSEYKLCDNKTHDYLSPNKQNVLCDYQSTQDVINKHSDFDNYKPKSNSIVTSIQYRIWQSKKSFKKAHIMYALPLQGKDTDLDDLMKTIEQVSNKKHFEHQTKFSIYNESRFQLIQDWTASNNIPMLFPSGKISQPINLTHLLEEVIDEFQKSPESVAGGNCILFVSGSSTLLDRIDDDRLAENLNKANIALKVIVYGQIPNKSVLKLFHQLTKKLISSSVEYAFAESMSSSPASVAVQNQIFSSLITAVYDTLQDVTEQTHILLKRETVRTSGDKQRPIKIDFTVDSTISKNDVLIELYTTGNPNDLAVNPRLILGNTVIRINTTKVFTRAAMVLYTEIGSGFYSFEVNAPNVDIFTTISVRVLSNKGSHLSYKEAPVKAKCWLQTDNNPNFRYPLRGFVQVSQGLNGPVYDADVKFTVRRITSQQTETNISLNDNGRGNPDISARDGIYSAYIDLSAEDSGLVDVAYTVTARIVSDKLTVKPGNFGNTIMFKNKPRCCGSDLKSQGNDEKSGNFERVINCGSLFVSSDENSNRVRNSYSIRDLHLTSIDADNRTITLEWNSPFLAFDMHKPNIIIKAFHSHTDHSTLPLEIKQNFDQAPDVDIELVQSEDEQLLKYEHSLYELAVEQQHQQRLHPGSSSMDIVDDSTASHLQGSQFELKPAILLSNTFRQAKIRILNPEEGFYFVAVKERDDSRQTRPSNIVAVYLKSNVPIENTTALAIDDSKMPEGPYRESLGAGPLKMIHILIICICSALFLFLVILLIICVTIKRRRQAGKNSSMEYKESLKNGMKKSASLTENDKTDAKQAYYLAQDASSLQSNSVNNDKSTPVPNSNLSNNTSCSSVNTVDQMPHPGAYEAATNESNNGSNNSNFEPSLSHNMGGASGLVPHPSINGLNQHTHGHQQHHHHSNPEANPNQSNPNRVKELNVATLLPNSWDAKELLDHWGRVQEAKQRQESPPVMRIQSSSPSTPSYGGSSSLDNYNHNNHPGYFAIHQPSQSNMASMHQQQHPSQQHSQQGQQHPFGMGELQSDYHQGPQLLYSPYSNASSIWQHHQQQQQQQLQQQQQQPFHFHPHQHVASPAYTITPLSSPGGGYDDNGLPEYSVVRKVHHPNISQV